MPQYLKKIGSNGQIANIQYEYDYGPILKILQRSAIIYLQQKSPFAARRKRAHDYFSTGEFYCHDDWKRKEKEWDQYVLKIPQMTPKLLWQQKIPKNDP